jgi:hypothetical protein
MISALLLASAWVFPHPAPQEPQAQSAIEVLNQAQKAAKDSGRILFVYLEAPW